MVHLMSRGHVKQTVKYINKCWKQQDTDISLTRHFVTEVLDMIGPPYSTEFINLFLAAADSPLSQPNKEALAELIIPCSAF